MRICSVGDTRTAVCAARDCWWQRARRGAGVAPEPVQAIWKHQEIAFYFQSFTTFYSCTGLEGKLERIMRELGVHAKVRVRSVDCPSSVARMPRVS